MELQPPTLYDNDKIKGELVALLLVKRAILMVGAGSSSIVGYPGWKALVIELRDHFYPDYPDPSEGIDLSDYAQKIKDKIFEDNREDEYNQFLFEKFKPYEDKENCTTFHISLVNLGFCGIVTTNYDKVLEIALQTSSNSHGHSHNCEPLDLCENRPYSVFPFLRLLNPDTIHPHILHLHGYHRASETIILTSKDYLEKYGLLDENEKRPERVLDTIHRKVIWALLTTHPLLFVGFSLTDPFFLDMITAVKMDFRLQHMCVHYAIMGYQDDEDLFRTNEKLQQLDICPIFYKINVRSDGTEDHTGLSDLILDLENLMSLTASQPPLRPMVSDQSSGEVPSTNLLSLNEMNRITGADQ